MRRSGLCKRVWAARRRTVVQSVVRGCLRAEWCAVLRPCQRGQAAYTRLVATGVPCSPLRHRALLRTGLRDCTSHGAASRAVRFRAGPGAFEGDAGAFGALSMSQRSGTGGVKETREERTRGRRVCREKGRGTPVDALA